MFTSRTRALLFFLPLPVLLFATIVVSPMVNATSFSFFDWNGFGPRTDFVGLENYGDVLTHRRFATAVRNSVLVIGAFVFIQLPLAMWVSLALVEKSVGVNVLRALFFVPFMLAEVAAGLIWRFIYDGDYGVLPAVGDMAGVDMPYVLADKLWVLPAVMFVIVWK